VTVVGNERADLGLRISGERGVAERAIEGPGESMRGSRGHAILENGAAMVEVAAELGRRRAGLRRRGRLIDGLTGERLHSIREGAKEMDDDREENGYSAAKIGHVGEEKLKDD